MHLFGVHTHAHHWYNRHKCSFSSGSSLNTTIRCAYIPLVCAPFNSFNSRLNVHCSEESQLFCLRAVQPWIHSLTNQYLNAFINKFKVASSFRVYYKDHTTKKKGKQTNKKKIKRLHKCQKRSWGCHRYHFWRWAMRGLGGGGPRGGRGHAHHVK